MSDEHKAALAEGRKQGRAVRNYLEAVEATKPKRGRKRTPESIEARLGRIDEEIEDAPTRPSASSWSRNAWTSRPSWRPWPTRPI